MAIADWGLKNERICDLRLEEPAGLGVQIENRKSKIENGFNRKSQMESVLPQGFWNEGECLAVGKAVGAEVAVVQGENGA